MACGLETERTGTNNEEIPCVQEITPSKVTPPPQSNAVGIPSTSQLDSAMMDYLESLEVICHALNIDGEVKPSFQKRRAMNPERYAAFEVEVDKLFSIGFIREAHYPNWVANPVLVKKPNGKWRTYVDFTDLNKAYPNDSFPLPRIYQLVNATSKHELLSFTDAYSRYN
ncbi:uncharacterized protein LOC116120143 [Pistacia vera]|uniref:uncharacterized protein LOC116120143 n=1 Tax=Pistacia vera TaxID=55513 RepID=UPI001263D85F|nr:uncharacterized protein LOC116120143 [Pistacia vera]